MPSFKELIEKNGKQLEISFTHWYYRSRDEFWSERNTYTSENIRTVNFKFDGALFTSVMRCLDITLEGNYTSAIEKGDAICNFSITVSDSAAHSSTINYGTFYVAKTPEYDVDTDLTKLCCYDEMYRAMQPYDLSGITFPISLKNYLKAICVRLNWQHANTLNYSALVNGDKMITSDPYIGIAGETESAYTFRDVLDEIARCAGCSFAFKSNANGDTIDDLYIIYETNGSGSMKESMFTLDESNLKSLSIGEQYGAINTVIYSRQPQEDNVFKSTITNESVSYNRKSVKLKQPEIADSISDSARLEWVTPLLTAIKGLQYRCYELESFGIGYMNFGDVFTIECYARNGNVVDYDTVKTYQTIYMRCNMTIDTNIRETTKLEMPVATATDYSAAKSATDKALRQTYLKVNKQLGEIRGLITDPDNGLQAQLIATAAEIRGEISDDINGLNSTITATAAEINTRITNEKASLQTQISANAAGISAAMSKAETVEGLIDGITDEISELAKNIEDFDVATAVHTEITKATTIQAIAGQVETNISGTYVTKANLPNELSGYAKQTDLPNMNKYVQTSVYNSKISQLDTDITSAVNRVTTIEQAGYITKTTAQSLINQSSTAITATVTSNIKIGTVNLLYDSACFENALFNYLRASTNSGYPVISDETDVPSKVSYHFYYKCTSTNDNVGVTFSHNITKRLLACNPSEIIPNEKYTFSFYAKGGSSTSNRRISRENLLYFGNDVEVTYDTDLTDDILIFSTWKRYRVTFSVNKKPEMFQIKFLHSGTLNTVYNSYFSSLKLERGNVITDWSDVDKSIDDRLNGELCTSVILNKNGLTVENGALTIKDADGDITISSGKVISNQIEFGTREEIATLSPSSTYFKSLTSAMKTTITGLNLGSDFQSLYSNGTGWKTWKESSVHNAQQNRIFINDYNNSFSIERNKYYTISCKYIVISKTDSKYPLIDFWVDNRYDENSDENFCEFKLFSTDVPDTVKKSNGDFDYYISYGEYSKTISGKKILTNAAVEVDSLSGLAVSARLFNTDCFNHIFDSSYNGYPLCKFYREGKILENLYYQDSGGNTYYLDTFEIDNNCIVAIKDFKITSFQGSAITAGAVMNYGDDCFIDFDEGHLKCNSARIGRVETTFESWGGRSIKSANRDVLRSDGGFVLSANNGNNAMILDFKSLSFNGIESQSTSISGTTNWRYLIYNINTGEVRSKEV